MKRINDVCNRNIFTHSQSSALILFAIILLMVSCTPKQSGYAVVEFKGKTQVNNVSKALSFISYNADSVNPASLLASPGDLFNIGDEDFFFYRSLSENSFSFKKINGIIYINDKIYSIVINNKYDMIPWFKEIKQTDISNLEILIFDSDSIEKYLPYLKELAKIKPEIGLSCGQSKLSTITKLLEIFKPRSYLAAELSNKDFNILSGLTNLEFLFISLTDSVNTIPLPLMPQLKQLLLSYSDPGRSENENLLINNKQLERLMVLKFGEFDFSIIKPLSGLKELVAAGFDTSINYDLINNQKQLEVLSLMGEKIRIKSSPGELGSLRWMTFPAGTTQADFNSFIELHPDLEVVEITGDKVITGLKPLLNLRKLFGLTITETLTDTATIKSLKNIKYLSLPDNMLKNTLLKDDLKRSLPKTKIVSNHGFCLGSGWLLLIIPLILFFRTLSVQKSGKSLN